MEEAEKKAVAGDASDSKKISSAASDLSDDASRGSGNSNDVDTNNVGNPSVTGANDSDLPTPDPELDFLEIDDPYASRPQLFFRLPPRTPPTWEDLGSP